MSGHVFHPGHEALHGITVVLETTGTRTLVGRYDRTDEQGVLMLDVAVHDSTAATVPREEFLRKTLKFGVRAERKHLVVPVAEVTRIVPLVEVGAELGA